MLWLALLPLVGPLANAIELPDFTPLIDDNSPAVVKITTHQQVRPNNARQRYDNLHPFFRDFLERQRPQQQNNQIQRGVGSGFIVSADGYILTNHHVIAQADEIVIKLSTRQTYKANIIGVDVASDLALLKIDATDLPMVTFADSDNLKVGSWVIAIGSPFNLDYSASAGIVSAIGRSLPSKSGSNYVPFIQTDVAINPGNSGGPLFNLEGKVIGVNAQIYSHSGGFMGLSFAIPSNVAVNVIKQLKEKGRVSRGYLGVIIQDVDANIAKSFNLDSPMGALISQVIANGPADMAGIKAGDIILRINRQPIQFSYDLPHTIGLIEPGQKVKAFILRKNKKITLTIKVGSLEEDSRHYTNYNNVISKKLGIKVANIDTSQLDHSMPHHGVQVQQVLTDSLLRPSPFRKGDIIIECNWNKITDVNDLIKIIDNIPAETEILVRFFRNGRYFYHTTIIQ